MNVFVWCREAELVKPHTKGEFVGSSPTSPTNTSYNVMQLGEEADLTAKKMILAPMFNRLHIANWQCAVGG